MSDSSDRVIPATPRRREAARRQGGMPTAALPAWVATAGTAVLLLPAWAATTMPAAAEMLRGTISGAARAARHGDVALPAVIAVVVPTVALVLAAAAAGIGVRILLDGFSWQPARALPMLRRIDPLAGLARIFSFRTLTTAVRRGLVAPAAARHHGHHGRDLRVDTRGRRRLAIRRLALCRRRDCGGVPVGACPPSIRTADLHDAAGVC